MWKRVARKNRAPSLYIHTDEKGDIQVVVPVHSKIVRGRPIL